MFSFIQYPGLSRVLLLYFFYYFNILNIYYLYDIIENSSTSVVLHRQVNKINEVFSNDFKLREKDEETMKNIEEYQADIDIVINDMAKIEGYLDVAAEHKNDSTFKEIFGDFVKNEIISFMKSIDSLTAAMKSSFILEHLTALMDPEAADIVDVCASIEFIEKRMKTIRAKHALYYFNCK